LASLAADHEGYDTVLNLNAYVGESVIPDELEDYIVVKFKKAILHLQKGTQLTTDLCQSAFVMPFLISQPGADDDPDTLDQAYVGGQSIEEIVNSDIAGDYRREFMTAWPMKKFRNENFGAYFNVQAYSVSHLEWDTKIDLTKLLNYLADLYATEVDTEGIPYQFLCLYYINGHNETLTFDTDSTRWYLELEWDYKPIKGKQIPSSLLSRIINNLEGRRQSRANIDSRREKFFERIFFR
jgi:hypothetical protein